MTVTMIGGEQLLLPFAESKKTRPTSMWERIGHLPDEWAVLHAAAVEANANRVRRKRNTKLTPSYLSEHPEFDHSGPPPPDRRCACGSGLGVKDDVEFGYFRQGGKWQCARCYKGICSWRDCEAKANYNRVDGKGRECTKHHCGWCSTPGCDAWSDGSVKDGAYVCGACSNGQCPCGLGGKYLVDGLRLCQSCAGYKCEKPGCGSLGHGRDADGRLLCNRHLNGFCEINGCETPAAGSHGRCVQHRANGDEWVAQDTVSSGATYLYFADIVYRSNGRRVAAVHGNTHETRGNGRMGKYRNALDGTKFKMTNVILLLAPDKKEAARDDDTLTNLTYRQGVKSFTDVTDLRISGFIEESSVEHSASDLLWMHEQNDFKSVKLFADINDGPDDLPAARWFMLNEDGKIVPHQVPAHRIANVQIIDTFDE